MSDRLIHTWRIGTFVWIMYVLLHFALNCRKFIFSLSFWLVFEQLFNYLLMQVHVSPKDNSYICRIVQFPHVNVKHHMIGVSWTLRVFLYVIWVYECFCLQFRPLISKGNEEYVHHMSLYHCQVPDHLGGTGSVFDKYFNRESRDCYSPNMPPEWSKHCFTFLFTWAVGSEGNLRHYVTSQS